MLEQIVARKYKEVAESKQNRPLRTFQQAICQGGFRFSKALQDGGWGLIAECKQASPVKGKLAGLPVAELAGIYGQNGASVLSVLTDRHFSGSLSDIDKARQAASLPVLRKDFIIDEYQIYEARAAQADAILLIAAILPDERLSAFQILAGELGMDCLVEIHSREELDRVQQTPAPVIGINNRNLKTFTTSLTTTFELLPYCDRSRLLISESGIRGRADALALKEAGIGGILVGEGLVTAQDIGARTRELALLETEAM